MNIMTTVEAAAYLRLAKPTLEKMRLSGAGPKFLKLGAGGRAVRYRASDLDEWMAARVVSSTSQHVAA